MNYASIVPLIGGETIAMERVFEKRPEYILSYPDFYANDSQLLSYYNNEVPYNTVSEVNNPRKVDVVNTVCPCAGLSSLGTTASASSPVNDWMYTSAKYVLENIQPKVFWGENAPRLASKAGKEVVDRLRVIAKDNGYTFSLYKTKSILHGLSQIRDRSFYFFWKGNAVPEFEFYDRPYTRIEEQIRSSARNDPDPMTELLVNTAKPSDDPWYQYILEEIHGGIDHTEFFKKIDKTANTMEYIEKHIDSYHDVSKWFKSKGYEKASEKATRVAEKLASGGNVMRKTLEIPKDHIGAFVGHYPTKLTHPDVDRHLSVRECLDIMKMPKDFQLQGGLKNLNMICQNVPVTTAMDMAENVKRFIEDDIELYPSSFATQDNKGKTFWYEKESYTLDDCFN